MNTVLRVGYVAWDAVFLCFDVGDKIGMYTIISWVSCSLKHSLGGKGLIRGTQWRHAIENGFVSQSSFGPLVHLVGMKKDKRSDEFNGSQPGSAKSTSTSSLSAFPTCCVGPEEVSISVAYRPKVS